MQIFYSSIDSVPAEIIFYDMQRMDVDGYRWALASFVQQPVTFYSSPEASRGNHGLYFSYSVLRFLGVNPPPSLGTIFG